MKVTLFTQHEEKYEYQNKILKNILNCTVARLIKPWEGEGVALTRCLVW